ncbi:MAG: hypothetical protein OXJ52_10210, partial [Oligoflexia bacterium]|nr:hypothetical protein [Oligoflexia bacterium]
MITRYQLSLNFYSKLFRLSPEDRTPAKADPHRNEGGNLQTKLQSSNAVSLSLFIVLLFSSPTDASLSNNICLKTFKTTKNTIYSLNKGALLQNSYSQQLFTQVYQQLPLLERGELSQKEAQEYVLQLEQLIQHLEKNLSQTDKRLQLLDSYLTPALENIPNIISSIKSDSTLKYESLDTQVILRLVLSTLSQHLFAYLT